MLKLPGQIEAIMRKAGVCDFWRAIGKAWDKGNLTPAEAFTTAMKDRQMRSLLRAYVILPLLMRRDRPDLWEQYQMWRSEARKIDSWLKMQVLLRDVDKT
jgi:hypothetical protein